MIKYEAVVFNSFIQLRHGGMCPFLIKPSDTLNFFVTGCKGAPYVVIDKVGFF